MEDIYYEKYIKYKTKYLELKELNGGSTYEDFNKPSKTKIASVSPLIAQDKIKELTDYFKDNRYYYDYANSSA